MRIHLVAATVTLLAGFAFDISKIEWICVILCIALVWAAEAFNTALEFLTDLASPDFHPLAKKTKDVAAAGVLVLSIAASIIGSIIFIPYFLDLF